MIPTEVIDKFESMTNFDFRDWANNFYDFIFDNRQKIIDYYSGVSKSPNIDSFDALSSMLDQTRDLTGVIEVNKRSLNNGGLWELVDTVSQVRTTLQTIDNSSRWLRSSISKNNFNPNPEIQYVLKQFQTLEALSRDVLGSSNKDQDWVTLALDNGIAEEDYTTDGGINIGVNFRNGVSIKVNSVVDNIQGENIYGKDIDKKLTYLDNDIKVLTPSDTVKQSVYIMANLRRGGNPEFSRLGVQSKLVLGTNIGSVAYPALFRNWYNTFATDDTLKSFSISKIEQREDRVYFEFKVETRLGEVLSSNTII